jgi:hypothetical protein
LVLTPVEQNGCGRSGLPGKRPPDGVEYLHDEAITAPIRDGDLPAAILASHLEAADAEDLARNRDRVLLIAQPNSQRLAHPKPSELISLLTSTKVPI